MSLTIGLYIQHALSASEEVQAVVSGRVYPVIAPLDSEVEKPFIVFASNGMTEASTKDGVYADTVQEEIMVFGRDLDEVEALAQLVREAMAAAWTTWNALDDITFTIADQTFQAGAEDYDLARDGYYLPLNYSIETEPIDN